MKIIGFQKLTLLDYPGKTACTVFTAGCNLRCPFCHNSDLVCPPKDVQYYDEAEIISYLEKRKGLIDGVCVTGGEPMLMKDLPDFCKKIKDLGLSVKLDTNGFFPSQLKYIVNSGLCDYVAMDIKNCPSKYAETVGVSFVDFSRLQESIEFLKSGCIDHEFRTTVCKPFHNVESLTTIASLLGSDEKYFLQSFVDSGKLLGTGVSGFTPSEMRQMLNEVRRIIPNASLRGVDN